MRTTFETLAGECVIAPGTILAVLEDGGLLVETEGAGGLVPAFFLRTSSAPPPSLSVGDEVLLAVDAARGRAYVLGLVGPYVAPVPAGDALEGDPEAAVVHLSGRRVLIEAGDELRLRCGEGTIVIDRHGKVVVRGTRLVSRARGSNKIKGASVAIN